MITIVDVSDGVIQIPSILVFVAWGVCSSYSFYFHFHFFPLHLFLCQCIDQWALFHYAMGPNCNIITESRQNGACGICTASTGGGKDKSVGKY